MERYSRRARASSLVIMTICGRKSCCTSTAKSLQESPEKMPLFSKTPKETAAVTYISNSGEKSRIDVPLEDSVMEGAIQNGVDGIVAECGGACQCGTCHVYVDPAWLDKLLPIEDDENAMLDTTASPRQAEQPPELPASRDESAGRIDRQHAAHASVDAGCGRGHRRRGAGGISNRCVVARGRIRMADYLDRR